MPTPRTGATTASEIRRASFHSQILVREWDYVAYLPPGYETSSRSYPVAYLLHGACGAAADYVEQGNLRNTVDYLIKAAAIEEAVLVTPNGFESWYVNHPSLMMQDAFLHEFIPHIEASFRIRSQRQTRLIGGLSMGGYGALRFALLRPDLFSRIAVMSPAAYSVTPAEGSSALTDPPFTTHGPDGAAHFDQDAWTRANYPTLIDDYLAKETPLPFHIASGDADCFHIDIEALKLYRFLRQHGQDARFCLAPGDHNWETWSAALEGALRFLLPRNWPDTAPPLTA